MNGAIGERRPFAVLAQARETRRDGEGLDDARVDRRLLRRLALQCGHRREPGGLRPRRYFHRRIARLGLKLGVERHALAFDRIVQARKALIGGGRDDRRQPEHRRRLARAIERFAGGDVGVDVAGVRPRRIGGIGAPRNARRETREPIAAGLFFNSGPGHLQRALGAPGEGIVVCVICRPSARH